VNQKKIGSFLKELRKEKGITQEEFAEKINVSGRTVSRWETGTNMPDISLLIEIAEFFDVSIPEIINGERKSEIMNEEVKEVAEKLSDYAKVEKESIIKSIRSFSIVGTIALFVYSMLELTGLVLQNEVFEKMAMCCEVLALVTVIMIMAHTTGLIYKLEKKKKIVQMKRLPKVVQMIIAAIVAFVSAIIIKFLLTRFLGL
jgi:transcriptional regulator with XRE-family HTH domain